MFEQVLCSSSPPLYPSSLLSFSPLLPSRSEPKVSPMTSQSSVPVSAMFYSLSVDPVCYQHSSHTHTVKERSISVTVLFKLTELKLKPLLVATELPSDSVAQLARAWQAIYQVVGSSPSPESLSFSPLFLSHLYFPPFLFTSSLCFSSLFPTFPSH